MRFQVCELYLVLLVIGSCEVLTNNKVMRITPSNTDERLSISGAPDGCNHMAHTYRYFNTCVTVMTTALSRSQAERACVNMDGHLLTITSNDMETFVNEILQKYSRNHTDRENFWQIEGRREYRPPLDDFVDWSGKKLQYYNWGTGMPDNVILKEIGKDCLMLFPYKKPAGPWYNYPCDTEASFLCGVNVNAMGLCKSTESGYEYTGAVNTTQHGYTCQRWDSQVPNKHFFNRSYMFPDGSVADANNYCRSPDKNDAGPWCYTVDGDGRFDYCNIPDCSYLRRGGCGADNFVFGRDTCVVVMTTPLNRKHAEEVCVKNKGHLLTIRSYQMEIFVNEILLPYAQNRTDLQNFWQIDGQRQYRPPTNQSAPSYFVDWNGQKLPFYNWGPGQPDNEILDQVGEDCLMLFPFRKPAGPWYNYPCHKKSRFVCGTKINAISDPSFCSTNNSYTYENTICVVVMTTALSRDQAEAACVALKGHLLTIQSKAMDLFVNTVLLKYAENHTDLENFWQIDGRRSYPPHANRSSPPNDFVDWRDEKLQYYNWGPDMPDNTIIEDGGEDCIMLFPFGRLKGPWYNYPCDTKARFVCGTQVHVTPSKGSKEVSTMSGIITASTSSQEVSTKSASRGSKESSSKSDKIQILTICLSIAIGALLIVVVYLLYRKCECKMLRGLGSGWRRLPDEGTHEFEMGGV